VRSRADPMLLLWTDAPLLCRTERRCTLPPRVSAEPPIIARSTFPNSSEAAANGVTTPSYPPPGSLVRMIGRPGSTTFPLPDT
jgi:hypothetical protein